MRGILGLVSLVGVVGGLVNFSIWVSSSTSPLPVIITHPLAILAGMYLFTQVIDPRFMGHQSRAESRQREEQLRGTGSPLAVSSSGGRIGRAHLRRGSLRIEVYPGGILLKPWFMASFAVLTAEISGLRIEQGVLTGAFIEVDCPSSLTNSPVALFVAPSSAVAKAIEHITGMQLTFAGDGDPRFTSSRWDVAANASRLR